MIKKTIAITGILITVVVILFMVKNSNGTDIIVAPKDAKLILDGTKILKPGKNKLNPGEHIIAVSRNGFESQTKEFDTDTIINNSIVFYLTPNANEGEQYYSKHKSEFEYAFKIANKQTGGTITYKTDKYPLIKDLPIDVSPLYRINYGSSKKYPKNNLAIAIYIEASTPADKQYALANIYSLGFDPSDYEIIFGDTDSLLDNRGSNIIDD